MDKARAEYYNLESRRNRRELVEDLKSSARKFGQLYPVLEDPYGNVIDGQHRLEADRNWPRIRLENIRTYKDLLIARLISNVCRRKVSVQEKTKVLDELGGYLLEEGLKPGEIARRISEEISLSYQWVMKYLPERYKNGPQSKRACSAPRCGAQVKSLLGLLKPPRKSLVEVRRYTNTKHAIYMIRTFLDKRISKAAEILKISPENFVQNIIEEKLRKVEALKHKDIDALEQLQNRF